MRSVTEGIDSLGEVTVRVRALADRDATNAQHDIAGPAVFHGNAADTDIIVASAKAYLKALNRMLVAGGTHPVSQTLTTAQVAAAAQGGRP